ncbi:PA0069 family radical SAM protein [Bordetella trematum]|uniref:PA0069 family radical SAM protein n=1 Tax=Bordetella trematum TaxID=123899 RepID=UPI001FB73ACD|nr:PA0069 family radical SAM protein [Bordetella trematum]
MMRTEHSLSAGLGSPAAAPAALRGRGAVTNVRHRFEDVEREAFYDGWSGDDACAQPDPAYDTCQDIPDDDVCQALPDDDMGGVAARPGCGTPVVAEPSAQVLLHGQGAQAGAEPPPVEPESEPEPEPEPEPTCGQRRIPVVAAARTQVRVEQARKLLSRNDSPDIPFDQAVNPYRGCEHGCVYCYARPTHAYLGYSPGLDFETRLVAKANAVQALRAELARPGYKVSPINIGSATDAYQPIERTWRLTRGLLELMLETRHPLTLVTKNALVERDIDLIAALAREQLITVFISVTTLDATMARTLEPRASAPWRRIETIRRLARAGVPVGVLVAPVIPFINDESMERILEAAAEAGASTASYTVVRLPWEVKTVFETWLHTHFPDRAQRVQHRIEDLRDGQRNDTRFGTRMRGTGVWADLLRQRFQIAARRHGLSENRPELALDKFQAPLPRQPRSSPAEVARQAGQMALFED